VTATTADLTWNEVLFDFGSITGYNIYRDGVKVGTSITNSFSDTGLTAETTYAYEVTAVAANAQESAKSTPSTTVITPL